MKTTFPQIIFLSTAIRFCDSVFKVSQYKNTLLLLFMHTETWALRIYLHLETPNLFSSTARLTFSISDKVQYEAWPRTVTRCLPMAEYVTPYKHTGDIWRVQGQNSRSWYSTCKSLTMCMKVSSFPLSSETCMTHNQAKLTLYIMHHECKHMVAHRYTFSPSSIPSSAIIEAQLISSLSQINRWRLFPFSFLF